jgi:DNA-binding protein H-NS
MDISTMPTDQLKMLGYEQLTLLRQLQARVQQTEENAKVIESEVVRRQSQERQAVIDKASGEANAAYADKLPKADGQTEENAGSENGAPAQSPEDGANPPAEG